MTDALDRLLAMNPEEGAAFLNQLYNPMRGLHVGARKTDRSQVYKVANKEQNKVQEKSTRRADRPVDYATEWLSVFHRAETANRRA